MKVVVATFAKDRFAHLQLCTEWLHSSPAPAGFDFEFVAYDDRSDDIRVHPYLCSRYDKVFTPPLGATPDSRIGLARQAAVDTFVHQLEGDYLLLLDSDIIVTKETIAQVVRDYESMVDDGWLVGGATLNPLGHIVETFERSGNVFGKMDLTGDAHMLFKRKHLELVGNHFGGHFKGFADTQIKAIIKHGRFYWSRINPAYQVQHIGIGQGGTTIYNDALKKPHWVMRPYWTHVPPRGIVNVQGFDVLHYVELVNSVGGESAPLRYLQTKGVH